MLGYADSGPSRQVFTNEDDLDALLSNPDLTPPTEVDFDEHVLFTDVWNDDGCNKVPTYAACLSGSTVTMMATSSRSNCDLALWTVNLLEVPRSGATRFVWE
jgi:hypothetical protein